MAVPLLQFKDCELDAITLSWSVWPPRLRALSVFLLELVLESTAFAVWTAVASCIHVATINPTFFVVWRRPLSLPPPTLRTPRVH